MKLRKETERRVVLFVGMTKNINSKNSSLNIIQPGFTDTNLNPVYNAYAGIFNASGAFGFINRSDQDAADIYLLESSAAPYITDIILEIDQTIGN